MNEHVYRAIDIDGELFNVPQPVRDRLVLRENHIAELESALRALYATVKGECPSVLDEDSGGNGTLDLDIQDLLNP